ncbi:MAG TPA: hypothetical protein VMV42_01610 [archaeon]|nr:hypothetical protein [archaeon]
MAYSAPITKSTGDLVSAADWNTNTSDNILALLPIGFTLVFDGGGAAIVAATKLWTEISAKCDIDRVTLLPDQSGSIVIDVWVDTYANYPPTVADTITASAKPTITASTKYQDSTLTGWTKSLAAGVILMGNVDSCTTITRCACSFKLSRS